MEQKQAHVRTDRRASLTPDNRTDLDTECRENAAGANQSASRQRFQRLALLEGGSSDFCPPRVRTAGGLASRLRPPFATAAAAAAAAAAWPLVPLQEGNKERVSVRLSKVSCLVKTVSVNSRVIHEKCCNNQHSFITCKCTEWSPVWPREDGFLKRLPEDVCNVNVGTRVQKQNKQTFMLKICFS